MLFSTLWARRLFSRPLQPRCVRGNPCALSLDGVSLAAGEKLMALLECGVGQPVDGFPSGGVATAVHIAPSSQPWMATLPQAASGSLQFTFSTDATQRVDSDAGIYFACWCRDGGTSSSGMALGTCSSVANFFVNVGVLTVNGPYKNAPLGFSTTSAGRS